MRLNLFRQLSKKEQWEEVSRALGRIDNARKNLDKKGIWNPNVVKELKEKGESVLWTAN